MFMVCMQLQVAVQLTSKSHGQSYLSFSGLLSGLQLHLAFSVLISRWHYFLNGLEMPKRALTHVSLTTTICIIQNIAVLKRFLDICSHTCNRFQVLHMQCSYIYGFFVIKYALTSNKKRQLWPVSAELTFICLVCCVHRIFKVVFMFILAFHIAHAWWKRFAFDHNRKQLQANYGYKRRNDHNTIKITPYIVCAYEQKQICHACYIPSKH